MSLRIKKRVAIGVAYEGTEFFGWQRQQVVSSIQAHLESALAFVANHPVSLIAAGRTDKGVHALGQVAHFDAFVERDRRSWVLGANTHLPPSIRVTWAQAVDDDFHARFSATARRYRYVIYNHSVPSALLRNMVTTHYHSLDENKMQEAALHFLGEHDFTSFRAIDCEAHSPIRTVQEIKIYRQGVFIFLDIKANGFLHHMVRNIMGVLIEIGEGKKNPDWVLDLLRVCDRTQAAMKAPANGLYFMQAYYPDHFILPNNISVPMWFD